MLLVNLCFLYVLFTLFFNKCNSLLCYSCFNIPNNIYPLVGPCPNTVDFDLMNIILCDDINNSCVLNTKKIGNVEVPVSAGCSWRRIEKTASYLRNCKNKVCEQYCQTNYCRYRW